MQTKTLTFLIPDQETEKKLIAVLAREGFFYQEVLGNIPSSNQEVSSEGSKKCTVCKAIKPINDFAVNSSNLNDGRRGECKQCQRELRLKRIERDNIVKFAKRHFTGQRYDQRPRDASNWELHTKQELEQERRYFAMIINNDQELMAEIMAEAKMIGPKAVKQFDADIKSALSSNKK